MGTTADKFNALINTKENIKLKLNQKGVAVDDSVPFSRYPDKMDELSGGSKDTIVTCIANQNACEFINRIETVKEWFYVIERFL